MIGALAGKAWVHVAVAFLAMGGWAVYANRAYPAPAPLIAGLVQGTLSGAITFGLKRGLDRLRARLPRRQGWWLPPLLACALSLGVLVGIHLLAGTPALIHTIALPFSVASTYAVTYNLLMWKRG